MALTDILQGMGAIAAITKNTAAYLRDSALSMGNLVSKASLAAAKDYGGVFKQVNFDLAYRNKLNLIGLKNLQLTNAELGDAVTQTAAYGFDLRMAAEAWFDISDAVAKTSYSIGASTAELAKLANYSNLLGGDFKEVAGYLIDIVGKTALTGSEVADTATEVSRMNLLFGRGGALTKESLATISKMADRLKQAGGNAKELVTAISGANARFTSAAGLGFLPGFATDKMGAGLTRYNNMLGGFSKMIMSQNAIVRGTLADAFGPLFNLSGDALLEFAVDATKELTPLEIQARDVNKVWKEMAQSMGESWDRLWTRIYKTFQGGTFPILASLNKLTEKFNKMFDDGLGNKIGKWLEGVGGGVSSWIDDFVAHFDDRMEEAKKALTGFREGLSGWLTWVGSGFKKLWEAVKNPWDWKTILGIGGLAAVIAILPGFNIALAGFGAAMLGVGYAVKQMGENGDKAHAFMSKLWRAFSGWGFTGLLTGIAVGVGGLAFALDAAAPGLAAFGLAALGATVAINSAVSGVKELEKIDGYKLSAIGGGLVDLSKGMLAFTGAGFLQGLSNLVTFIPNLLAGGNGTASSFEKFASMGGGLKSAGEGINALAAGIKAMPSKFAFEFDDASFQSARRLRDAVTVIDGGSFALQRVVSLFERLDLVLRSLSMAKEFRLPSVTEAMDLLYRQAGTTARALTAVSASPASVSSAASPVTSVASPLNAPKSSAFGNVFVGVVEAIERQTKLMEEQAKAEKERAAVALELERSNNNTRAQSGAARTPATTTR